MITRKLAIFIGTSNVPNSLIENLEFRDLLQTANPRYNQGRSVICQQLEAVCIELIMKAIISSYILQATKISICTNIWSQKGLTFSYLGIQHNFFARNDHYRHCVTLYYSNT